MAYALYQPVNRNFQDQALYQATANPSLYANTTVENIDTQMPPEPTVAAASKPSGSAPHAKRSKKSSNAQQADKTPFINYTHPSQSRDPANMQIVRRKAMLSHIDKTKPRSKSPEASENNPPSDEGRVVPSPSSSSPVSSSSSGLKRKKNKIGAFINTVADPQNGKATTTKSPVGSQGSTVLAVSSAAANSALTRRASDPSSSSSHPLTRTSIAANRTTMGESQTPLYPLPPSSLVSSHEPFMILPQPTDPKINTIKLKKNFVTFFGSPGLLKCWAPIASQDKIFYLSSLCISARHTDVLIGQPGNPQTLALENEVLGMVRQALSHPNLRMADTTIAALLFIACANVYAPAEQSVQWYKLVLDLITMRGGLEALRPADPALAILILVNSLCSPLVREKEPHPQFILASKILMGKIPIDEIRYESPICYMRHGYRQLRKSRNCSKQTLALLDQMRHISEMFNADGPTEFQPVQYSWQKQHILAHLLEFPSALKTGHENSFDFYYESVRIAALIQDFSLFNRMSFADTAEHTDYVVQLQDALKKTKVEDCWGDMAGVLLWILLIGACAANKTPQRQWIVATMIRVNMKLAFEYGPLVLKAVYKLLQLQNFNHFPK